MSTEKITRLQNTASIPLSIGSLADIKDVSVDKNLSREERIAEFVRQIKDPYCFKCGEFTVTARFSEDGVSLEDCLQGILL